MFSFYKNKTIVRVCSLLIAFFLFTGCSLFEEKIEISWFDTDGELIESATFPVGYDPASRELPEDSDEWHYTEWTVTQAGQITVCTAKRVAKSHIVWKDHDGTILHEEYFVEDEDETPKFDLPENNEKWNYVKWEKETIKDEHTCTAIREPNGDYFVGNVFQIVVKDKDGEAFGTGSGFILNSEGWFITNNHVMEEAHSASAFFDIKDEEGGRYTELQILGGVFNHEKKDIFIGKIAGYEKIADHYKEIDFCESYEVGEECYSVGYPNSSVKMEINKGTVKEEYSDIHGKLDGVYYILSDSYIAPGSSGGILVNGDFEVIGITSLGLYNNGEYTSGGSIPYELFKIHLKSYKVSDIKKLTEIYK